MFCEHSDYPPNVHMDGFMFVSSADEALDASTIAFFQNDPKSEGAARPIIYLGFGITINV